MTIMSEVVEFPHARTPAADDLGRLLRPAMEGRGFAGRSIAGSTFEELHALMALSPGMAGASPTRVLFVTTPSAKAKLAPHLAPKTRDAAVLAPACVLIGYDRDFAEQLIAFVGDGVTEASCFDRPGTLQAAALRNGVLQGAYLTLSARALGLEAVFLRGYDGAALSVAFFGDPGWSATHVALLGYPAGPGAHPPAMPGELGW